MIHSIFFLYFLSLSPVKHTMRIYTFFKALDEIIRMSPIIGKTSLLESSYIFLNFELQVLKKIFELQENTLKNRFSNTSMLDKFFIHLSSHQKLIGIRFWKSWTLRPLLRSAVQIALLITGRNQSCVGLSRPEDLLRMSMLYLIILAFWRTC